MERKETISAADLNLSEVVLSADRTSDYVHVGNAREAVILYQLTRVAETDLEFRFDFRASKDDAQNFVALGESVSQSATLTTAKLEPSRYTRDGITASINEAFVVPVYGRWMRIRVIRTAGTTDTLTVRVLELR